MSSEPAGASPYLRAIRAHLPVVALVLAAAVGAAVLYLATSSRTYEARARLLVNPIAATDAPPVDLPLIRDSGDPVRTIQTAAALITLHEADALTARRMGAGWTPDRVGQAIDVRPEGQSSIVDVTASASDPAVAAQLANRYVAAVLEVRRADFQRDAGPALRAAQAQLRGADPASTAAQTLERQVSLLQAMTTGADPNLSPTEAAVPPASASGPPAWLVVVLALLAGGVLATGTVLLLESIGPARVRSEDELLEVYSLPLLARMRRIPPGGPRRLGPVESEAFRAVRIQLELDEPQPRALVVTSPSRQDGKTFVAAGLALELAHAGAGVILVDADLRKPDLRRALGLGRRGATPGGRSDPDDLEALLEPVPGADGLKLLEMDRLPQVELNGGLDRTAGALIQQALAASDYVIVDTPPLGEISDALMLIGAADRVLLVARLGTTRRTSLEVTRDLLERSSVQPGGYVLMDSSEAVRDYPYARRRSAQL